MCGGCSRRQFLAQGAVGTYGVVAAMAANAAKDEHAIIPTHPFTPPLLDLHAHLDNSTIDAVVALGKERNVRFGIVEHAGTKENKYPVVISNDDELARYLAMLEGKGVYAGVQAEWTDWTSGFSRDALARLDTCSWTR